MAASPAGAAAERPAAPRLLLEEPASYSPNTNPFADRPTARTPQGIHVLAAATSKSTDDWVLGSARIASDGATTPRLTASWDLPSSISKLSARQQTPRDSDPSKIQANRAAKWLQSMSPASKAAAAAVVAVAGVKAQPAAAAAAVALVSPRGARTADSPASGGGFAAPTPASVFPRSHPINSRAQAVPVQASPPGTGLASWLRMSTHFQKPEEAEEDLPSDGGSDVGSSAEGSPRPRSQLDFDSAEAQPTPPSPAAPAVVSAAQVAPAEAALPSPKPAAVAATAEAAASPEHASSVSPRSQRSAMPAAALPAAAPVPSADTMSKPAAVHTTTAAAQFKRGAGRAGRPAVLRALLALCLLGCLLGAPLAVDRFAPGVAQRSGLASAAAHLRQLSATASQHAGSVGSRTQTLWQQGTSACAAQFYSKWQRHGSPAAGKLSNAWSLHAAPHFDRARSAWQIGTQQAQQRIRLATTKAQAVAEPWLAAAGKAAAPLAAALKPAATQQPQHAKAAATVTRPTAQQPAAPAQQVQRAAQPKAMPTATAATTGAASKTAKAPAVSNLKPSLAQTQPAPAATPNAPLPTAAKSSAAPASSPAAASHQHTAATPSPAAVKRPTSMPSPAVPAVPPSAQQRLASRLAAAASQAMEALTSRISVWAGKAGRANPSVPAALGARVASTWQGLKARLPAAFVAGPQPAAQARAAAAPGSLPAQAAAWIRYAAGRLAAAPAVAVGAGLAAALAGAAGIAALLRTGQGAAVAAEAAVLCQADGPWASPAGDYPTTTPAVGGRTRRRAVPAVAEQEAHEEGVQATPGAGRSGLRGTRSTRATPAASAQPSAAPRSTRRARLAESELATPGTATARRRSTRFGGV